MYRSSFWLVLVLISSGYSFGQDSTQILDEVTVQSYLYNRPVHTVPASIGIVRTKDLARFNDSNILSAVNTVSGVRMEERSPGSYRLSIRGSLIRSPFGVRNVKVYWNRLPLTDGGGNTYLNLVDPSSIGSIEVIKGPGGSLYGAGTGGVVLLSSPDSKQTNISFSALGGSYDLQRYHLAGSIRNENVVASIAFVHQESDGYREHSAMERDVLNANVKWLISRKNVISGTFFASDIFYQTPGGLTLIQFKDDPKQARPAGTAPGAVEQKASVMNKSIFAGLNHDYFWNENTTTHTGIFYSTTEFVNYAIRNLEERDEKNIGLRTETQFNFKLRKWDNTLSIGGEVQGFISPIHIFENELGVKGDLTIEDELESIQTMLFLQNEFQFNDFFITLGGSFNWLRYSFERLHPEKQSNKRNFDPVFSPRIAVLKNFKNQISLYGSISSGFSPPSLAEVRPSTNAYNNKLKPEQGINMEIGIRGVLVKGVTFDLTGYSFKLKETIVLQRTDDGADFFVNAGKTKQRGLESTVRWSVPVGKRIFRDLTIWSTQTFNHYRFDEYINDDQDYSGNKVTGVPPTIITAGLDITLASGLYSNITATYTDHIPLHDANEEFAPEYTLLGVRLGYRGKITSKIPIDIFGGMDNALDEMYSLGNDLNAVGGRFYNAAPGRNYFVGIKVQGVFANQ
jgi:iron complex outermembrane receptor protein